MPNLKETVHEQHDPSLGLGEFLGAMLFLSQGSQTDLAVGLGVSQQSVSRYLTGKATPNVGSETAQRIAEVFKLSDNEVLKLFENNEPRNISSMQTRPRKRREVKPAPLDISDFCIQMMGALVLRTKYGPPLNEEEVGLVKYLIQQSNDAHPEI